MAGFLLRVYSFLSRKYSKKKILAKRLAILSIQVLTFAVEAIHKKKLLMKELRQLDVLLCTLHEKCPNTELFLVRI